MNTKNTLRAFTFLVTTLLLSHCGEQSSFYNNVLRSDLFVQQYNDSKYDFLWMIDGSASMGPRRTYVVNDMQNFLNILNSKKAIDYQMAVTNVDMFSTGGHLAQSTGGLSVVKSATSANPAADFDAIVNNIPDNPATSFWEQGLESAYQAINQFGGTFRRSGIPLVLIFVSDEDDYSCAQNCFGVEPEHNDGWTPFTLDRYINFFQGVTKAESTYTSVFAVTGVDYSTCPVATVGARYMNLAAMLGGVSSSGSICDSEIQNTTEGIASTIANRGTTFKLSSTASGSGMQVFVNGKLVQNSPDNYVFESNINSIVFTGAIPANGSTIEVTYNQLTN